MVIGGVLKENSGYPRTQIVIGDLAMIQNILIVSGSVIVAPINTKV